MTSCFQCQKRTADIACKYCQRATYCSESCGNTHWFSRHKDECIGKDPSKSVLTLDDLFDRLENIPEPSESEVKKMAQQAWNDDPYLRSMMYSVLLSQREEACRQVVIENFLGDYMKQRNVHPNIVRAIQDEVRGIQEDIVNATLDLVEKRENPKDIGEIDKRVNALNNAVLLALGTPPAPVTENADETLVFQSFALEMSAAFAETVLPICELGLVKNDEMTRAYGFEPNPLYEGTDAEIQARIDAGVVEKPAFWDERFNVFLNFPDYIGQPAELIGMRGVIPKGEKKQPRILPQLRGYTTATGLANTEANADVRTRTQDAYNGFLTTITQLPQDMWARIRDIARVLASKDCVEAFTALATSLFIVCKLVDGYYMVFDQQETIDRFTAVLKTHAEAVDKAKLSSELVKLHLDKDVFVREHLVKFLKEHKTERLHLVPIVTRMQDARGLLDNSTLAVWGQSFPEDQYAWEALDRARNLAYAYFKFRLTSDGPRGSLPLSSWMKARIQSVQDRMTKVNPSADDIQEFFEVSGDLLGGMAAVDASGPVASAEQMYETVLTAIDGDHRLTAARTEELIDHVDAVLKSKEKLVEVSADLVQVAQSTSYMHWFQAVAAKMKLSREKYMGMMYVASAIGLAEGFLLTYNITDNPASREYMTRIAAGGSTHFFEYALNSPATFSRAGMFFISNGWTLGWLVALMATIEQEVSEPLRRRLHRRMQGAMKNPRWNMWSVNIAEMLYNGLTGIILTGPRYLQAFALHGVVFGLGMVYVSYMYNTFPMMAHLATARAALSNIPGAFQNLTLSGLGSLKGSLETLADGIINVASFLEKTGRVLLRPERFDPFSLVMPTASIVQNVFAVGNAVFGGINATFNAVVMYETLRGFRNPFRIHTTLASDADNPAYLSLQEEIIYKSDKPAILRHMQRAQNWYSFVQVLFIIVALYGVIRQYLGKKAIDSRAQWPTYRTKKDFAIQRK